MYSRLKRTMNRIVRLMARLGLGLRETHSGTSTVAKITVIKSSLSTEPEKHASDGRDAQPICWVKAAQLLVAETFRRSVSVPLTPGAVARLGISQSLL